MELVTQMRHRMQQGEAMLGTFVVELHTPAVPRLLQQNCFDFMVIDTEHGCFDPAAVAQFRELEGRIRSMALVHETLYQSASLARIDLQDYLETLVAQLRAALAPPGDIRFSVAAAGVEMGLDIAVPCGLILNELITNALKYAFPGGQPRPGEQACEITVSAEWDSGGGVYTLTVADNGVGLPADLDWATTKTLGLRLVGLLGQYQLGGQIELDRARGTSFRLVFASRQREQR